MGEWLLLSLCFSPVMNWHFIKGVLHLLSKDSYDRLQHPQGSNSCWMDRWNPVNKLNSIQEFMFTLKFTFGPTCLDYLSNIRLGISKQAGLFIRRGASFRPLWVSKCAVIQPYAGNKAYVFISTFKRTYLLFISHRQEKRHDSTLYF